MKRFLNLLFIFQLSFLVFLTSCENPFFIDATQLYEVSFETNGGSPIDSYRTRRVEKCPLTEKDGYTFLAWYLNANLTEKVDSFPLKIDSNTKLYAKWKQNFLVTFVTNGGSNVNETNKILTCELLTSPISTREGYEVIGWYTNAGFNGKPIVFPYEVNFPVTLYAKWLPTFTVNFVTNGGTAIESKRTSLLKVSPKSERNGYELVGWYADEELTEIATFPFEITKNVTLYARWEKTYTVSFNSNGGTPVDTIKSWRINEAPFTGKSGYSFGGWYTTDTFVKGTAVTFPYYPSKDVTFYARWTDYTYSVDYVLNGGTNNAENQNGYDENNTEISLYEPTREGCVFEGWYANSDFSGEIITEIPANSIGDKVFYAKWKLISYSISYVLNGGTESSPNPNNYTVETKTFLLNSPSKTGYNFCGWYEKADFSGQSCKEIEKGSVGNKKLYAKWIPTEYAITYNLNGGKNNEANPASYTIESATFTLLDASRNGYSFAGWYENANCDGVRITQIAKGSYGTKSLYAKWNVITYSIEYVLNGGTNSTNNPVSYTIETETISLVPPIFDNNYLGKWYENADFSGNAVSLITKGSYGDKTLYARKESNNAELARLSFYGNEITVYDNADDRNEIAATVNIHEYYIEYQSIGASANVEASFSIIAIPKENTASVTLSNKSPILKIKSLDSTQQDVTLTVTAEDGKTTNTYLIHAVRVFSYSDACKALTGRNCAMRVKIVDTPSNIKLERVYSEIYEDPNMHFFRRDLSDTPLSKALDSESLYVVLDVSDAALADIGSYAFYFCTCLKSVLLPVTLNTINEYAFSSSGITEITIPESVTTINNNAFQSCRSLSDVKLSNSITYIGAYAFGACVFSSIRLPDALTTIATHAFTYCANLTHIEIPAPVSTIGYDAFEGCPNITSIVFEDPKTIWFYTGYELGWSTAGNKVGCMNNEATNADLLVKRYYNYNWYNSNYRNY